ncbi:hypothetical protein DRJ17_04515 [Candidatus Woesearchaeota archaeon]|nr:MAG: hypothetical protein DRJ17_04515 [Candidatus Woesearchaeota archaeon]
MSRTELERLTKIIDKLLKQQYKRVKLPSDPVEFCVKILGFKPLPYQEKLLRDQSKRIVVKWPRQSGKSTTIAARAIWFAVTHPKTLTLIVAPSKRQSMIMMDKIHGFLLSLPKDLRRQLVLKMLRTVIRFKNGSQIVALPCSVHLLRGYTAHQVITDEAAFFKDDEDIFYSVLYPMLSTTDGTLIVSSTPWGTDSVFYKMCIDPNFSKHFLDWREVVKCGLVSLDFIEEMKRQLPAQRFKMEFEAEFVEDEDSWLTQDLIAKCIDAELDYYSFDARITSKDLYIGIDFGKKVDYSVVTVVEKENDVVKLIHLHRFPLETPYASVIGYVKTLYDRWKFVRRIYTDVTGVGEYITEDMKRAGLSNVTGITLTLPRKEEIMSLLKAKMQEGLVKIPYDKDLIAELNVEKFELTKDGRIKFYHPAGTHDDRLWAFALAVYAAFTKPRIFVDKAKKIF